MHKDYGLNGHPITGLFKQPKSPEEWQSYTISEEQIKHFKDHGFIKY